MANGGIIGPNNPVGKIGKHSKISVITATGTFTVEFPAQTAGNAIIQIA